MSVRVDLEADAGPLVEQVERATRAMGDAEAAAEKLEQATDDLSDTNRRAARSSKDLEDGLKGTEKIAKTLGGPLGAVADTVFDLEEGLGKSSKVLGPWGTMLAGAGLAAVGLGMGLTAALGKAVDLARAAAAAANDVKGLVPDEAQERAAGLGDKLEALDKTTDALTVRFAGMNPLIEDTVSFLTGAADVSGRLLDEWDKLGESKIAAVLQEVGRYGLALATLGVSEGLRAGVDFLVERGQQAADTIEDLGEETEQLGERPKRTVVDLTDEIRKAKEAAKEAADRVKAWTGAMDGLQSTVDDAESDLLTPLQKVNLAYNERMEAIARLEEVTGDAGLADEARAAAAARLERDRIALLDDQIAKVKEAGEAEIKRIEDELEAWQKAEDEKAERREEEKQARIDGEMQVAQLVAKAASDTLDAGVQIAQQRVDALEAEKTRLEDLLKNNKTLSDDEKEAAHAKLDATNKQLNQAGHGLTKLVVAQKMAAISEIAVNTAVAITQALRQLGPIAGGFAAGAITATGLAQAAIVGNQQVPTFHSGTMGADEFMVGGNLVRQGERGVVLNQRAVENGAVARVVEENRGLNRERDREVRLVLGDAGRVVGELVARESRRPGSAVAAAFGTVGTGTSDPYGSA